MRIEKSNRFGFRPTPGKTVAKFGPVRLVRHPDGLHQLSGGNAIERAMVREWCLEHAPFVRFAATPDSNPMLAFAV
jgi:hypothetical protein